MRLGPVLTGGDSDLEGPAAPQHCAGARAQGGVGTGEPTDRELWERAADGDGSAFGVLFDRHARAVHNHCFRLTASWSTAEDLTSTVFLQTWRHRSRLRLASESLRPWLLAVATNVVRAERRSLRRRLALAERLPRPRAVEDPADDVAARLDDERQMAEVLVAVRRLPRAEQEAVALCLWAGVSYADAANVLGIAEVSVRSRVSRAKSRLRGALVDPLPATPAITSEPLEELR
jgi:RNA polymerase sigma factor (sigma-70 family)